MGLRSTKQLQTHTAIVQTREKLRAALLANPGFALKIVGHSLGAGTAAILTTRCPPSAFKRVYDLGFICHRAYAGR